MVSKRLIQIVFNLILVTSAFWVIWESYGLSLGSLNDPGPGFLPFYSGLFLVTLCLVNLKNILSNNVLYKAAFSTYKNLGRLAFTIIILVVTVIVFERIGYIITMTLFMVLLLTLVCGENWKMVVIITGSTVSLSYLLFKYLLQTQLPIGPLGF